MVDQQMVIVVHDLNMYIQAISQRMLFFVKIVPSVSALKM
jgi:hypothetical protein